MKISYNIKHDKKNNCFVICKTVDKGYDKETYAIFCTKSLETAFANLAWFRTNVHNELKELIKSIT